MNTLLGIAQASGAQHSFLRLKTWLESTERGKVTDGQPSSPGLLWGCTSNAGVVLGIAHSGGRGLGYLGNFHGPFPGMRGGSALDDPHQTARALLRRYAERGLDFLTNLCGHFAVVIVEPDAERVILARGHGSAVRWFVAEDQGKLAFSTKLADLPALLGPGAQLDRSMEDFLLGYEFLPDGQTPFRGVRTLLQGKILDWQRGTAKTHELAPPSPWGGRFDAVDYENESEVVAALHESFEIAVAEQSPTTAKVGVLLGGLDSALIAASLKRQGKDVHTFSFRYDDSSYNQAYTEELARQFGLTHHWVPITPAVLREGLERYAQRFNQTLCQPHYVIATAHACRVIRDHGILHCLTGDGCDGLFLGYPTVHLRAKLIQTLSLVAPLIAAPLELLTRSRWWERKLGHPYRIGRNVGRILRRPMPARAHIASCTLDSTALQTLRGPAPAQAIGTEQILVKMAEGLEGMSPIRLAYLGKSRVGLNGVKLDGSISFSGISLNSPYLHPGLEKIAKRIPDALSRPDRNTKSKSTGKYAFMQMVEKNRLLPREMIYQKKRSPVTAPVDDWYWGELRDFILSRIEHLPFAVNQAYAESLVTPKLTERLFRAHIGIGRHTTPAASLLATYASYAELVSTGDGALSSSLR